MKRIEKMKLEKLKALDAIFNYSDPR